MSDTVDLIIVGVEGDIPRADMSSKLVKAFNQDAFTFEALLDGAYGESAPYAAQTNVEPSLAESGKEQLEKLGLICTILPTGERPQPVAPPPAAKPETDSVNTESTTESDESDSALASFKAGDNTKDEEVESIDEVAFDVDEDLATEDSALASFKKDAKKDSSSTSDVVDFSDDLEAVGADDAAVGLVDAKKAKNDFTDMEDSYNQDFSDQIEEVGADKIASGLKEAQSAKPDFAADVEEVDFSDDAMSIGIREQDSTTPEVSKSKLAEETAERNLASFPKEDTDQDSVDFSDELEILSSDAPLASASEGPINKADVPEALADADGAGEELDAELIDPAPAEKEDKQPVEVDDGGLTLSADNDTPLTAPKEKATTEEADDGGLSLSDEAADTLAATTQESGQTVDATVVESLDTEEKDLGASSDGVAESPDVDQADTSEVTPDSANENASVEAPTTEPSANDATPKEVEPVTAVDPTSEAVEESVPEAQPVVSASAVPPADEAQEAPAQAAAVETQTENAEDSEENTGVVSGGLVLPGQLSRSVVPEVIAEDDLENASSAATAPLRDSIPASPAVNPVADTEQFDAEAANDATDNSKAPAKKKSKKKAVAALAGVAVLAGAGSFAFMNAGSLAPMTAKLRPGAEDLAAVQDATSVIDKMRVDVAELKPGADFESLSTGELLVNLSNNQSNGIVDLEPYFLESGDQVKRGPRIGAAIPAESEWMIRNRQSHPADSYFDNWSNRDADLSLFLALFDNLIEKGDLEVAQQLSDRAKDKLFSVMSTQRLARAYSDVGEKTQVTRLMSLASRDTYTIKAPEERVLALSDYAFTEQAIGLNEGAMDTFLKTSILARSLVKPERRAVGLSSAAMYFHRSGRTEQAQELLQQALEAGNELPRNTAARDLAIRYIALSESRMGLFNQALENTKMIVDPIATVSAYHGIALAIESSGDDTNARKVLNMAYRAGSQIEDPEERSNLLSKVVLASESD